MTRHRSETYLTNEAAHGECAYECCTLGCCDGPAYSAAFVGRHRLATSGQETGSGPISEPGMRNVPTADVPTSHAAIQRYMDPRWLLARFIASDRSTK